MSFGETLQKKLKKGAGIIILAFFAAALIFIAKGCLDIALKDFEFNRTKYEQQIKKEQKERVGCRPIEKKLKNGTSKIVNECPQK